MRVAVVHDWLATRGGSERVLEEILDVLPEADLFALFDTLPAAERGRLEGRSVRTSYLQRLMRPGRDHRILLPLMPAAVGSLDVSGYDLVVSSSHSVAKNIRVHEGQRHLCYCHSPMRWAWDMEAQYLAASRIGRGPTAPLLRRYLAHLRAWDRGSSTRVHRFIANSAYVRGRIARAYARDADVLHPPVDVDRFRPGAKGTDFVTVSRLVPYKRIDVLVDAFARMPDRKLLVVGDGPQRAALERRAPPNVRFAGRMDDRSVADTVRHACAFLYAAEEDFGIAMAEAQAAGKPVVALAQGGAAEIVEDGRTGILFHAQTADAVVEAVERLESSTLVDAASISASAARFAPARFRAAFADILQQEGFAAALR